MLAVSRTQLVKQEITLPFVKIISKNSSTKAPNSIFIEKSVEEPVVILRENDNIDLIGPPDLVSNLRPVLRKQLINETPLQQKLREMQDCTQAWNHQFWMKHNKNFINERQQYVTFKKSDHQLTADEMSEFYKEFLDKYWEIHLRYNIEWYKKNFSLLFLDFQVHLERIIHRFL